MGESSITAVMVPQYPIYIPSKGRADRCHTAEWMLREGLSFYIVVEESEQDAYIEAYGAESVLVLPQAEIEAYKEQWIQKRGYSLYNLPFSRSFCKRHAEEHNWKWHWQIDDNIRGLKRVSKGKTSAYSTSKAFTEVENFCDRYSNLGAAGIRHVNFASGQTKPMLLNHQVYCCILVLSNTPAYWRNCTIEDTDFSLQLLSQGYCTILFNAFCILKEATMTSPGGCSDSSYQGDGRVRAARSLAREWPGILNSIKRKHGRPRILLKNIWSKYPNRLLPTQQ